MVFMVRLTKGETNELLNKVSEDNYIYGLIFKLIYLYGKDGITILGLKWDNIDFKNQNIRLKGDDYPLSDFIIADLLRLQKDTQNEYLFLEDTNDVDKSIDILRKRLRYYLNNNVKRLDVNHKIKHVALSITDLRRLRGQHLFLDGVNLKLIMELYQQHDGTSTQFKRYLEYNDLMEKKFPCKDMSDLFNAYTELGIFDFESDLDRVLSFAVSYEDLDFVISISKEGLDFVGEDIGVSVMDDVTGLFDGGLLKSLYLLGDSEYLVVGGFSFVRL